ncbi:hypothetical protein DOTSEDRAFT_39624 [Dothistroma septosporum NZE10]|uniref:Uncharacterized protein n=1 Tax=Dothistroma septosporum (strain NZE10 / CBS 128990) TaxID=675120 RepID=M2XZG5_DOTSN|nr:hypothetical protein DOTSEDRAFT_39624 [Dothistroma septosporum NZE10]
MSFLSRTNGSPPDSDDRFDVSAMIAIVVVHVIPTPRDFHMHLFGNPIFLRESAKCFAHRRNNLSRCTALLFATFYTYSRAYCQAPARRRINDSSPGKLLLTWLQTRLSSQRLTAGVHHTIALPPHQGIIVLIQDRYRINVDELGTAMTVGGRPLPQRDIIGGVEEDTIDTGDIASRRYSHRIAPRLVYHAMVGVHLPARCCSASRAHIRTTSKTRPAGRKSACLGGRCETRCGSKIMTIRLRL